MYLFHVFRSFLPLHNPIGFGASDFVVFSWAALLVILLLVRAWIQPYALTLARKTGWCVLILAALVIGLRLALLPLHPVPTPAGADDFAYLLLADTLTHFRLANAVHPMHQFFETTFVLQQPSYSSIYPLGPAIVLALGQLIFGLPWVGVLLSMAALAALCYWMLRGWTTPGWALLGGLLAICEFGPLNSWMNSYWGGAVSAIAGSLVFGALPRLREGWRTRDSVVLGIGIGLQMITRPYESIFLDVSVVLFFLPEIVRRKQWLRLAKAAAPALLAVLPWAALLLCHNKAVTGDWTTLPYMVSRYQYGVPTTFTFQANPLPHAQLTAAQQLYYEGQAAVHDAAPSFFVRLGSRAGFSRFFLLSPLILALGWFVPRLREFRFAWIVITLTIFSLGSNFYPYFFPHYIAAVTCLLLLACVVGLAQMNVVGARWLLVLCGAHFLFWYGVHAAGDNSMFRAMGEYETGDGINYDDPQGRSAINRQLAAAPGRQLVFVRYFASHRYNEWIHNAADIDQARLVFALDVNPEEDAKLKQYYPDRTVWLLEPDALPPRLVPYPKPSNLVFEAPR